MCKESNKIQEAYEYAKRLHLGQKRKGGKDYITHPTETAEIIKNLGLSEEYIITALFHDLLEDTRATEDDIKKIAGEKVLEAVKLLTKKKGTDISVYLSNIKKSHIALCVKSADRLNNVRSLPEADNSFIKKYIEETEKYYINFIIPELKEELKNALSIAKEALFNETSS